MTDCPQCGTSNKDDAKNCQKCRINLYWATQHYPELAAIREASTLPSAPETPSFLVEASQRADQGPVANWLLNTIKKRSLKKKS